MAISGTAKIVIGRPYFALSPEAISWLEQETGGPIDEDNLSEFRDNTFLVQCVEALGGDVAGDDFTRLQIVTIDDEYYRIVEGEFGEEVELRHSVKWRHAVLK